MGDTYSIPQPKKNYEKPTAS